MIECKIGDNQQLNFHIDNKNAKNNILKSEKKKKMIGKKESVESTNQIGLQHIYMWIFLCWIKKPCIKRKNYRKKCSKCLVFKIEKLVISYSWYEIGNIIIEFDGQRGCTFWEKINIYINHIYVRFMSH